MAEARRSESETETALVVDSASLYEIVATMNLRDGAYGWARESAEALTTALLRVDRLRVAGSPGNSSHTTELYRFLPKRIGKELDNVVFAKATCRRSTVSGVEAPRSPGRAGTSDSSGRSLTILMDNPRNFKPWREHAMAMAWTDHSLRLGGLFNHGGSRGGFGQISESGGSPHWLTPLQ